MLLQWDVITFLFSLENLAASALKSNCPKLFLVCLKIFLICTEVAGMSREYTCFVFLFKSNHFQKTHNIIKFGTNYCIFAPVGRWTNPPLRDHPSVPIWWGISLITGLWSPESRLSFARTTVTFTRTPGAVGMIISASIHCPEWFYGLFRTDSMPNLAFSDSFCFASKDDVNFCSGRLMHQLVGNNQSKESDYAFCFR